MTDQPLAIDLYTGLHGWAEGLIAAGWRVIGFDLEDMSRVCGEPMPAGDFLLVLQNVLTLHGSQLRGARLIVGSSPCTAYSYMAQPWTKARARAAAIRAGGPAALAELNRLYDAQFRLRLEAEEASGQRIPLVVENVRGAEPWVGPCGANFGSYCLWGDIPDLMPIAAARKVPGFRFDGSKVSFQEASVRKTLHIRDGAPHTPRLTDPLAHVSDPRDDGVKVGGLDWNKHRSGQAFATAPLTRAKAAAEGRKGAGAGAAWFDSNLCQLPSASPRRKIASAKIAKIPFALAYWIGLAHHPEGGSLYDRFMASELRERYRFVSKADDEQTGFLAEIA